MSLTNHMTPPMPSPPMMLVARAASRQARRAGSMLQVLCIVRRGVGD